MPGLCLISPKALSVCRTDISVIPLFAYFISSDIFFMAQLNGPPTTDIPKINEKTFFGLIIIFEMVFVDEQTNPFRARSRYASANSILSFRLTETNCVCR